MNKTKRSRREKKNLSHFGDEEKLREETEKRERE